MYISIIIMRTTIISIIIIIIISINVNIRYKYSYITPLLLIYFPNL